MLKDGEKGVIRQRGTEEISYAIAPHLPCGVVKPKQLRKLADVAEKYKAAELKITSAARIAIIGISEADVDGVWKDLGMDPGFATGLCVRSVKVCPGIQYCRLGQQDSLKMGMELDHTYHGMVLPSKMKMGFPGARFNVRKIASRIFPSTAPRRAGPCRSEEMGLQGRGWPISWWKIFPMKRPWKWWVRWWTITGKIPNGNAWAEWWTDLVLIP